MRTMKQAAMLYAPEGENAGSWMELSSPTFKGNKGTAAPAIRVFAALREVQPSAFARLDPRASANLSDTPELGGPSPRASLGRAAAPSPLPLPSRASLDDAARTAPVPAPVVASTTARDGNPPHVLTAAGDEILHLFSLTADVRSFKSTRRMPFPTASVVVKLTLPAALLDAVELGGRSHAAVATPVRTNPPAQVARASEVTLQNGTGTVDFGAGVMALATALASGPRVAAEVWHKDAYAEDTLLGAATVSLAPLLREFGDSKLTGIVNGIDLEEWSPECDPHLDEEGYTRYQPDPSGFEGKAQCKRALQKQLGLPERDDVPLLGFIGRLDHQKGVDLITDAAGWLMNQDVQLIMLGSGRADLEESLRSMENAHGDKCKCWVGFSVEMAHRITAGCDILLMPSRFEPCGLNQLYAMRYGTVPVVHAVGGLRETVTPYNPHDDSGTGWQFDEAVTQKLTEALGYAIGTYKNDTEEFKKIAARGMAQDLSWELAAEKYEEKLIEAKYSW